MRPWKLIQIYSQFSVNLKFLGTFGVQQNLILLGEKNETKPLNKLVINDRRMGCINMYEFKKPILNCKY